MEDADLSMATARKALSKVPRFPSPRRRPHCCLSAPALLVNLTIKILPPSLEFDADTMEAFSVGSACPGIFNVSTLPFHKAAHGRYPDQRIALISPSTFLHGQLDRGYARATAKPRLA
jgi:hypothetical protein